MTVPGPCDQLEKGCCFNSASGVHYCSQTDTGRLSCNVAPEGEEFGLRCEGCGGENEPCCFGSNADAKRATPSDLATSFPACNGENLACMLDEGSANQFGKYDSTS
jgi:hypothetical protein